MFGWPLRDRTQQVGGRGMQGGVSGGTATAGAQEPQPGAGHREAPERLLTGTQG